MADWVQDYSRLLPPSWEVKIDEWLAEDIPSFDFGGFVVGNKKEEAALWCKESGVLAGKPFVDRIFAKLNCTVEWHVTEGSFIDTTKGKVRAATVRGEANALLLGERTALNLIARASGIATRARIVSGKAKTAGWKGRVAGTRKTTPGFRLVEKYALLVGGCDTHRHDLSSMIMLKDNHVWSSGSITEAVKRAKSVGGFSIKIEVECQSEAEAIEAISAGADIVMLDNFHPDKLKEAAKNLKQRFPHVLVEASGGVTVENVDGFFDPHVDVISMGLLTQSVPHIDFSLKIIPRKTRGVPTALWKKEKFAENLIIAICWVLVSIRGDTSVQQTFHFALLLLSVGLSFLTLLISWLIVKNSVRPQLSAVGLLAIPLFLTVAIGPTSVLTISSIIISFLLSLGEQEGVWLFSIFSPSFKAVPDFLLLLTAVLYVLPVTESNVGPWISGVVFASYFALLAFYLFQIGRPGFSSNELVVASQLIAYTLASTFFSVKSAFDGTEASPYDFILSSASHGLGFVIFSYCSLFFKFQDYPPTVASSGVTWWKICVIVATTLASGWIFLTQRFWILVADLIASHLPWFAYWGTSAAICSVILWVVTRPVPIRPNEPRKSNTIARKVFHLMAVAMFLPIAIFQPSFMKFSYGVALMVLIFTEFIRFTVSMAPVLNSKDSRGMIVYSHIALLAGCALPVMASPASSLAASPHLFQVLYLTCGILFLGFADSAASVVGSNFGYHRWTRFTSKTLEGTAAALFAIIVGAAFVVLIDNTSDVLRVDSQVCLAKFFASALSACLLEAFSEDLDNLIVPPIFATLLLRWK